MTGTGQALTQTQRETQVTQQMNHLGEAIGELEAIAEELTERLVRVCAPPTQPPKELEKVPIETLVPLADDIKQQEVRIRRIVKGLRIVSGSIEL